MKVVSVGHFIEYMLISRSAEKTMTPRPPMAWMAQNDVISLMVPKYLGMSAWQLSTQCQVISVSGPYSVLLQDVYIFVSISCGNGHIAECTWEPYAGGDVSFKHNCHATRTLATM